MTDEIPENGAAKNISPDGITYTARHEFGPRPPDCPPEVFLRPIYEEPKTSWQEWLLSFVCVAEVGIVCAIFDFGVSLGVMALVIICFLSMRFRFNKEK